MKAISNFLPTKLYNKLNQKIESINLEDLERILDMSYETKTNELLECIPLRFHKEESMEYRAFFICKDILDEFRLQIRKNINLLDSDRITFQVSIWDRGSFLGSHYDTRYKYGATLYLNDWKESWGGLLKYRTGSEYQTICPAKNLFVIDNCKSEHQVTMISEDSPQRRKSIQVWIVD